MSDRAARIASLTLERRRLLEVKLAERARSRTNESIPVLPRRNDRGDGRPAAFPVSPQQRDLLFIPAFLPPGAFGLRLRGQLDVRALEASLETICARHEVLRMLFDTLEGEPVQILGPPGRVPLDRVDLRAVAPSSREGQAHRRLAREAQRPFDLSRDPLLRATLVRLGDEEHVLLVVVHHIACDGWSLDVLGRELGALYGAERSGGQAQLPELAIQYQDYAVWQLNRLQDGSLQESERYWTEQLARPPEAPNLPTDRPHRAGPPAVGAWRDLEIAESLLEKLRVLSRRHDATLFMTLLAAWVALLHRYSGDEDIVVVVPFANRNRVEVDDLIGCFANGLFSRHRLDGNPTFAGLLQRVRRTMIGVLSHGEPTQKLAEDPPLLQVHPAFFLRSASRERPQLEGLEVERIDFEIDRGEFSTFLSLVVEERDRELTARLYYDPNRFRASTATRMLEHLHALLERVVEDPAQLISTLPPTVRPTGQTDWPALGRLGIRRVRIRLREAGRRTRNRFRRVTRRARGGLRRGLSRARRVAGRLKA